HGATLVCTPVVRAGDVATPLAGAAHVATETFRTGRIEHAFLEPEACLAVPGEPPAPLLHLFSPGQGAWGDRRQIASLRGLQAGEVRVTQVSSGGGFGGKEDLSVQGQTALLAWTAGRP